MRKSVERARYLLALSASVVLGATACGSASKEPLPILGRVLAAEPTGNLVVSLCTYHERTKGDLHMDTLAVTATKPDGTPNYNIELLRTRSDALVSGERVGWSDVLANPSASNGTSYVGFPKGAGLGYVPGRPSDEISKTPCVQSLPTDVEGIAPGGFVLVSGDAVRAEANGEG